MTITERMAAWHRQRRVLLRVSRAAWRLEQAERERSWALASARAEGISIRTLASAAGLSPARVHQITAAADMDELDAALGGLRAAGWPTPEDPDGDDDAELDGRDLICDRLLDEVGWLRQCAGWLTHLHTKGFPSAVNLRPEGDHPDRAHVVADLPRVAAILQRVAADIDELARARRVADLAAAVLGDRRAERRRRAAEPDLDFREFCRRSKLPQSERSWDLFAAERYRRGETGIPSYEEYNPFRHRQPGLLRIAPCREAVFSELDALTRFLTPFLPAPLLAAPSSDSGTPQALPGCSDQAAASQSSSRAIPQRTVALGSIGHERFPSGCSDGSA